MKKEDSKARIFQEFLLEYFASNQSEWEVYAKSISLEFLKEYNNNFNFMLKKLKELNQKSSTKLTQNEWKQGEIISNIITLREKIKVNRQIGDVEIDFRFVDEMFVKVENKDELKEMNKAIESIDNEELEERVFSVKELKPFKKLDFHYVYFISFVKEKQTRKNFYSRYLENRDINTNISTNVSLSDSSFMLKPSSVVTSQ